MHFSYDSNIPKKVYFRKGVNSEFNDVKSVYEKNTNTLVWTASQPVTYMVDNGVSYVEEVEYGASCLNPTTFTPSVNGWTFLGWREDTGVSSEVLSTKTMDTEPITLYAVYKKEFTHTFYWTNGIGNYTTTDSGNAIRNYSGSQTVNATTTPTRETIPSDRWEWRGWSAAGDTAPNAAVTYAESVDIDNVLENADFYALYQRTLTLSYNGNGATDGSVASQSGTQYLNGISEFVNPSFILQPNGFNKPAYAFSKWALGSVGGTQYNAGDTISINDNIAVYALWTMKSWVTIATYSNNITIGSNTGSNKKEDYTLTQSFSNYVRLKFDVGTWSTSGDDVGIKVIIKDNAGNIYGTFNVKNYEDVIEVDTNGATTIIISHAGRYSDGSGAYTQALRLRGIYGIPK